MSPTPSPAKRAIEVRNAYASLWLLNSISHHRWQGYCTMRNFGHISNDLLRAAMILMGWTFTMPYEIIRRKLVWRKLLWKLVWLLNALFLKIHLTLSVCYNNVDNRVYYCYQHYYYINQLSTFILLIDLSLMMWLMLHTNPNFFFPSFFPANDCLTFA